MLGLLWEEGDGMAGKPRNRLELRRQHEAAEPLDPMEDETEEVVGEVEDIEDEPKPKKKPKAAPKKPKATKAVKPAARMRIAWHVVNDAFKTVGTFEFSQKEAAEARAAELTARGKGTHFVQKVKEAMADDAPGLGAMIPRPAEAVAAVAAKPPKRSAKAAIVEDEVIEDDEFEDDEDEDEEEEEEEDDE